MAIAEFREALHLPQADAVALGPRPDRGVISFSALDHPQPVRDIFCGKASPRIRACAAPLHYRNACYHQEYERGPQGTCRRRNPVLFQGAPSTTCHLFCHPGRVCSYHYHLRAHRSTPDRVFMIIITFCIMIPSLVLTLFFDTAAVFEERKVFDSIHRSIGLVTTHLSEVIAFIVVSIAVAFGIVVCLMVVWEAFLYDKLEPITRYTEAQLQTFTPEQLVALIGPDGMWITAVIIFLARLSAHSHPVQLQGLFFQKDRWQPCNDPAADER